MNEQVAQACNTVHSAAQSEWVERLGRAGLVAKGVLYGTIAVLSLQVAFPGGGGGETTGKEGAIKTLAEQPLGTFVLVVLTIGLIGYALWRLVQAVVGNGETDEKKDAALRAGFLARGLLYISLAVFTVRVVLGAGAEKTGEQEVTARLLEMPFGVALVVLAGLIMIGVGLYEGYKGVTKRFREHLQIGRMTPTENRAVTRLGTLGLCARAVVFSLIGIFLIRAAITFNPDEAVGIDGALATVAESGPGPLLLGIVALGLLAYAVYCFAEARYARIRQLD